MKLRRISKKISVFVLTGILLSSLLTGCDKKNNSDGKQGSANDSKSITVMIPDWGAPTDDMLKEFKKESGIDVKVIPTAWDDIKSKVSIASAGKKAPADVIEVDWSWVGEFKSAGWLETLTVDEATQKDIPSISYFKYGNDVYAIPYANGVRLSYLNKDMMSKANITSIPKNWTELEKAFKQMKDKKVIEYPFLFPLDPEEKTTTSFMTLAYTRNNIIFNKDNTLNRESVYDTLKFIEENIKNGNINPMNVSTAGIDVFKGINNAKGAFLIGPTSFVTSSNDPKVSKVVGQLETIPTPGKNGPATKSITFTEAVGVSSYSENKESAKKFVEWFSQPKTQLALNKAINNTPTRTSVLEEMIKNKIIKNPGSLIEQSKLVSTPFPNGVPKYYTKMSTEIFNVVSELGQGKLNAKQATDKMIEKVNKVIEEK